MRLRESSIFEKVADTYFGNRNVLGKLFEIRGVGGVSLLNV